MLLVSTNSDPYLNLAVENHLVDTYAEPEPLLYLWRNSSCVVIGQHQNPYTECDLESMRQHDVKLVRRRTGGGAVFHDYGNLNFSFICPPHLYDQQRQFGVIIAMLRTFGLDGELTGRNDLLCDGRKFSGSAFSKGRRNRLHHGTILIEGDTRLLTQCLHVDPSKLAKHGVASVRSRVVNLGELCSSITPASVALALQQCFEKEYNTSRRLDFIQYTTSPDVLQVAAELRSNQWLYGRWGSFRLQQKGCFTWGMAQLSYTIDSASATLHDVAIASDSLCPTAIELAREALNNYKIGSPAPALHCNDDEETKIVDDIFRLVNSQTL